MDNNGKVILNYKDDPTFDYAGGSVLFAFSANNIPDDMIGNKLLFELAFYCRKGKFQATFDKKTYKVEAGQMLLFSEDWMIDEFLVSGDAEITIIGYTWDIIEDAKSINVALWPMVDYIFDDPVINPTEGYAQWLASCFPHLEEVCRSENALFKDELVQTLAIDLLYEFIRMISGEMRKATPQDLSRGNEITRTFFDILASRRGRIHGVTDVADLMNLTPKYLSRVIKETTGEKPMTLIHQYIMRAIDQELRYTDKSIKDIAFQLRFPSLAFFGKFVKQRTGLSPTEYRKKVKAEQG